jgi:GNAT superfamily N-acetyltransferase
MSAQPSRGEPRGTIDAEFRAYGAGDRQACLRLFDASCPGFFAANERADYEVFLDTAADGYEVATLADRVVGAFGLKPHAPNGVALRWIVVAADLQGHGIGSAIMARVVGLARASAAEHLYIGASHRSAPFFAHFGARETATIPHGWGPDMHRVDMLLIP